MEKLNLPFFYQLGVSLNRVAEFQYDRRWRAAFIFLAYRLDLNLRALMESSLTLRACQQPSIELLTSISKAIESYNKVLPNWDKEDNALDNEFIDVITKARRFETILNAELQTLDTYHVTQKGIYDTTALIQWAEKSLPVPMLNKIGKEVVTEIRESGKCLAFDCATASAFHIMRATEAVLHKYYISVCKPKSEEELDNWGAYISALYNLSEDNNVEKAVREDVKKVVALLRQIKDQDRNLIMHPKVVLSPNEAFTLFEIAKGAIMAMAGKLPAPKKKK